MKILLLIHGLITLAAALMLIFFPATIPSIININVQPEQYLICYLLGAAELAISILSILSIRIKEAAALKVITLTIIVFHSTTALLEMYSIYNGANTILWANVFVRAIVVFLFAYFGFNMRKLKMKL